jgi:hypothetical protein
MFAPALLAVAARGRMTRNSVNSPGWVSTSIEATCCLTTKPQPSHAYAWSGSLRAICPRFAIEVRSGRGRLWHQAYPIREQPYSQLDDCDFLSWHQNRTFRPEI